MSAQSVTFNFQGKRALVTGAGRGIGRAIAIALTTCGAETYALSKTKENLDSLTSECPSIKPVCVDLSDWSATRQAVESLPPIDLLVNNAGILNIASFLETTQESFNQVLAVNATAVLNVSQVVVKSLMDRKASGSIVNISSVAAKRGIKGVIGYCASKGALDQMTRTMAVELGPHNIRVNTVNATLVLTDMGKQCVTSGDSAVASELKKMIPLGRFVEIHEVVEPVLYLLSDSASMVTGDNLMIDGGLTAG